MEKYYYRCYLYRLANILNKFAGMGIGFSILLLLLYLLLPVFSFMLVIIYAFLVLFWAIASLMFLFAPLANEEWRSFPEKIESFSSLEGAREIIESVFKFLPAVVGICYLFFAISIGIYIINRKDFEAKKRLKKTIITLICLTIFLVILFIIYKNNG